MKSIFSTVSKVIPRKVRTQADAPPLQKGESRLDIDLMGSQDWEATSNQFALVTRNDSQKPHLIVFDWDNTLFFTRAMDPSEQKLAVNDPSKVGWQTEARLKLEDAALSLLEKALDKGHVMVVTSATTSWPVLTSKLYYPKLHALLQEHRVPLISTMDTLGSTQQFDDKSHVFDIVYKSLKKLYPEDQMKVFQLGDSKQEFRALRNLEKKHGVVALNMKLENNAEGEQFTSNMAENLVAVASRFDSLMESEESVAKAIVGGKFHNFLKK